MRKRVIAILLSVVCILSLGGCGAADSETVSQTEEEVTTAETAETNEPESESGETENVEAAEAEEAEPEESVVTWYMDEEGIKSDEFGMMIRKDNGVMEEMRFVQHMWVYGEGKGYQQSVSCEYYEGSLDNYVVQNPGYEKTTLGEYECALGENVFGEDIVFVGNGIALEVNVSPEDFLENESVEDYLVRMNLQPCDEFLKDCLAYFTDDGLYCPVFGISVTYNEEGTREYGNEIDGQYIKCNTPYSSDADRNLTISDESYQNNTSLNGMGAAESAEEALEIYVASCMEPNGYRTVEYTELEGTIETEIGGYSYLGRGLSWKWKDDDSGSVNYEWLFCSDDIAWTISVDTDEEAYEPCLSVIESIQ